MQAARTSASEPQPNLAPPHWQQQPARTGGYGLRDSKSDEEDPGEAVHHAEPPAEVSDFGSYEATVQSKTPTLGLCHVPCHYAMHVQCTSTASQRRLTA